MTLISSVNPKSMSWGGSKIFLGTSAENQVKRERSVLSLLVARQTVGFYAFTAAWSFCFSMAFQHPKDSVPWMLTSWFFINAVSLGHFFCFVLLRPQPVMPSRWTPY